MAKRQPKTPKMGKYKSKLTQDQINLVNAINTRLTDLSTAFGITGDAFKTTKEDIKQKGFTIMSKTGKIRFDKNLTEIINLDTHLESVENDLSTNNVTKLMNDAYNDLMNIYNRRAHNYGDQIPTISRDMIIEQVNAHATVEHIIGDSFSKFYENWKNKDSGVIYDKGLEEWLDEKLNVGSQHIWTESEYVEVYEKLKEFNKLI